MPEEAKADCAHAAWLVRTRKCNDADGNLVMTSYARPEVAPAVEAAFDAQHAELERERAEQAADVPAGTPAEPAGTPDAAVCDYHAARPLTPPGACLAGGDVPAGMSDDGTPRTRVTDGDALLAMAKDALASSTPMPDAARRDRFRMTVSVDPLSGWGRMRNGELLPPSRSRTS